MSAFTDFFKKAHGAIANLRGANNFFFGKDGEIVYSKNNVCIHDLRPSESPDESDDSHTPGYMTIHCLNDEQSGITLVLQWLPNTTLEKNPASIRCVSPRHQQKSSVPKKSGTKVAKEEKVEEDEDTITQESSASAATSSTDICVEMNGDMITVSSMNDRPQTLVTTASYSNGNEGGLFVPSINVIPHTPVDARSIEDAQGDDRNSISSATTSGADELSDKEDLAESSSCDETDEERSYHATNKSAIEKYRQSLFMRTPEQFAREHNLVLEADQRTLEYGNGEFAKLPTQTKMTNPSLFSVNLGKMRSMRLFYSNPECTCGQLVIASPDSQYKILHFHHGGMDKLAQLFEQWNVVKTKSVKDGSPSPMPDRHLLICHPAVSKSELDPEDGLYETVNWGFWKSYIHQDGSIDDSFTIRKAIFFASMDPSLRKEIWPYLLRVYSWSLTYEQKESVRNDLFLEYQNIRKRRLKITMSSCNNKWTSVENTIIKDVVRTDRKNPFFAGDQNPNMDTMKNILLNYATVYPDINYIQGMSDLLAPLLVTLKNESDTYWCFAGLMQQTLFASAPTQENNMMDVNLEYLRELLKLLLPEFFNYLASLGGDSLQLMFVHRWILLFFKREFPEKDAHHIWEARRLRSLDARKMSTAMNKVLLLASFINLLSGEFLPEEHSERLFKFDPDDLIILFLGDPQYHFPCTKFNADCKKHSRDCRLRNGLDYNTQVVNRTGLTREAIHRLEQQCIREEGNFANQVQRKSIFDLNRNLFTKPAVMVINGDLTNYGLLEQLDLFKDEWLTMPIPILPGLGNHDYENNVNDCVANQCANRMLYWFVKYAKAHNLTLDYVKTQEYLIKSVYRGSFAYSKDICNRQGATCVHLIQLNNRPDYVANIRAVSDWDIHGSYQWLLHDLNSIKNLSHPIFINLHHHSPKAGERLQSLLEDWISHPRNQGVNLRIAVLYAHWHDEHSITEKCIAGTVVHYIYVGSVPNNRYTTMKFLSDAATVEVYLMSARNNRPTQIMDVEEMPWGKC
ncbi:hypothetical protein QR680_002142 [Steinernema hermaphroditum]|uniref:Rab-GAP TBC domain-containing protein n=1 Tax=Steinernema hermaphroditum TaxID=289476 RepID=A0AA39H374_9BILA|nr:hypothetical protein QR680_002142 [Steinernema hermaphroditum]